MEIWKKIRNVNDNTTQSTKGKNATKRIKVYTISEKGNDDMRVR